MVFRQKLHLFLVHNIIVLGLMLCKMCLYGLVQEQKARQSCSVSPELSSSLRSRRDGVERKQDFGKA